MKNTIEKIKALETETSDRLRTWITWAPEFYGTFQTEADHEKIWDSAITIIGEDVYGDDEDITPQEETDMIEILRFLEGRILRNLGIK